MRKVLRTYFFETLLEFLSFLIYPWKFQTKQINSYNLYQIVSQLLEIFRFKIRTTALEIPHDFFLITLRNSMWFLINLWKFHLIFLQNPWKFHIHTPAPLPLLFVILSLRNPFFLWIAHCKEIYLPHPAALLLLVIM